LQAQHISRHYNCKDGVCVDFRNKPRDPQRPLSADPPSRCVLTNPLDVAALNKSNTLVPCLCRLSIHSLLPSAVLSSSPHHSSFISPCQDASPQVPCQRHLDRPPSSIRASPNNDVLDARQPNTTSLSRCCFSPFVCLCPAPLSCKSRSRFLFLSTLPMAQALL